MTTRTVQKLIYLASVFMTLIGLITVVANLQTYLCVAFNGSYHDVSWYPPVAQVNNILAIGFIFIGWVPFGNAA